MIDAHCHIDAYADPYETALLVERSHVLTIAVTNLPSAFKAAYPHVQRLRSLRLAVGLHPLLAEVHARERAQFATCLKRTSFVGEVGLDFSAEGIATRDVQIESFQYVLGLVKQQPKFVTIHSRRAEAMVLDLVEAAGVRPVVFHWFSGSLKQVDRLLAQSHFCSVNPAMLRSRNGKSIIERLPPDRVLTETDGPFVMVERRPALPMDVTLVEHYLAQLWQRPVEEVRQQVRQNLRDAIPV